MPITLKKYKDSSLVQGYSIEINDENELVRLVAELLLGHHRHFIKIMNKMPGDPKLTSKAIVDEIIDKLENSKLEHRDGWLFQMISWIAVRKQLSNTKMHTYIQHPHPAPAQHGIDGLAVVLGKKKKSIHQILITEDKATNNPRNKIQSKIFKEFEEYENSGKHDMKIVSIVGSLLSDLSDSQYEKIESSLFKKEKRSYRIGITLGEEHRVEAKRKKIFKDFDTVVVGSIDRRKGDILYLKDLRPWMQNLSEKIIQRLKIRANVQ